MPHILGLRERASASGDASTSYKLEFNKLEPGERWRVKICAFRNNTSPGSRTEIYLAGHGYNHHLYQLLLPQATDIYRVPDNFDVEEGETLTIEFFGGGSADAMEAWLSGSQEVRGGS